MLERFSGKHGFLIFRVFVGLSELEVRYEGGLVKRTFLI
jgi:hypothetical protein